jgi:hypothetical protein
MPYKQAKFAMMIVVSRPSSPESNSIRMIPYNCGFNFSFWNSSFSRLHGSEFFSKQHRLLIYNASLSFDFQWTIFGDKLDGRLFSFD